MRIAHLADVHLDRPFAGLIGGAGDQARQRLRRTFQRCLQLAVDREVDLVTIGGDLWEDENVRVDTRRFVAHELGRLDRPVMLICGNHDPYLAGGNYARTEWPANVHVVDSSEPTSVQFDGVDVWGVSWTGGSLDASFLRSFRGTGDRSQVLLLHGTSQSIGFFAAESSHCPFDPAGVREAGFSVCLAGHIHSASHQGDVVYPGSPEPLGWSETGDHCVAIVDIGEGVGVELVPVNEHSYMRLEVDCAGSASSADLEALIEKEAADAESPDVHVRFELVGEIDRDCEIDISALGERVGGRFAEVQVVDSTSDSYDLDELAARGTVQGMFVRDLRERISGSADPGEREKLTLALTAGLRALDGRRDVIHVD